VNSFNIYFDEDAMDTDLLTALRSRGVEVVTRARGRFDWQKRRGTVSLRGRARLSPFHLQRRRFLSASRALVVTIKCGENGTAVAAIGNAARRADSVLSEDLCFQKSPAGKPPFSENRLAERDALRRCRAHVSITTVR
jgi:hypothetical protein